MPRPPSLQLLTRRNVGNARAALPRLILDISRGRAGKSGTSVLGSATRGDRWQGGACALNAALCEGCGSKLGGLYWLQAFLNVPSERGAWTLRCVSEMMTNLVWVMNEGRRLCAGSGWNRPANYVTSGVNLFETRFSGCSFRRV